MPIDVPGDENADLAAWCAAHLGSAPASELFRSGHLSVVIGLRLEDAREVVVKVRPASPRVAACVEVQRRLFAAGYPCPEPIAGPAPLRDGAGFRDGAATAEAYVAGGSVIVDEGDAARLSASALARLVELAPRPAEVGPLGPPPSWAAWDQPGGRLWPQSEDADLDLDAFDGPAWIDRAGRLARDRLRTGAGEAVIGHCDWLPENVLWENGSLFVVHDWDSAITESEDVLVGLAAALYSPVRAGVDETERFLDAYGAARGRALTASERERSWAAGVWTRAYDAKFQHATGHPVVSLSEPEARERLRLAGLDLG